MNKANGSMGWIGIGLAIACLVIVMGCGGYVVGEGYYGETVVVPEPDQYLFGGVYFDGREAHNYSHRGFESRGEAHGRQGTHSDDHKGGRR